MAFKNILLLATAFATIAFAAPSGRYHPSVQKHFSSARIVNNCPSTVYVKKEYPNGEIRAGSDSLETTGIFSANINREGISYGITNEDPAKTTTQPPQLTYAMTYKDNIVWTQLTDINLQQPDLKPPFDNSKYSWKMESTNPVCKVPTMGAHSQPIPCNEESIYTLILCPDSESDSE